MTYEAYWAWVDREAMDNFIRYMTSLVFEPAPLVKKLIARAARE